MGRVKRRFFRWLQGQLTEAMFAEPLPPRATELRPPIASFVGGITWVEGAEDRSWREFKIKKPRHDEPVDA